MTQTLTSPAAALDPTDLDRLPEVIALVTQCNRANPELLHRSLGVPLSKADRFIEHLVALGTLKRDPRYPRRVHVVPSTPPASAEEKTTAAPLVASDPGTAPEVEHPTTRVVRLDDIEIDTYIQPRSMIDQDVVDDYADAYRRDDPMPALELFQIDERLVLVAGFHRHAAACAASLDELPCMVRKGTEEGAVLYAIASNATNGARMSRKDKRKAIDTVLRNEYWRRQSDNAIGKFCGVDHKTVAKVRRQLEVEGILGGSQDATRAVTRGGKTYSMKTSAIGAAPEQQEPSSAADVASSSIDTLQGTCDGDTELADPQAIMASASKAIERPKMATLEDIREAANDWRPQFRRLLTEVERLIPLMRKGTRLKEVRGVARELDSALRSLDIASR